MNSVAAAAARWLSNLFESANDRHTGRFRVNGPLQIQLEIARVDGWWIPAVVHAHSPHT